MARACLRLTDLLATLRLFAGDLPRTPEIPAARAVPAGGGLAAGARGGALASLDDALAGLTAASRASVLDPLGAARAAARVGRPARVWLPFLSDGVGVGVGAATKAPARQVDQTTCGSAVLSMLAMAGDPWLALQVARDPAHRFAALQHRVHRACARTGPVPWPLRLGTAPWAAAAVARYADVRYTHRVVGGSRGADVLRAAVAAASAGIPVPLFAGGDLGGGWQAAVPRHVVLLVDAAFVAADDPTGDPMTGGDGVVRVYEPSSAMLHVIPAGTLLDPEAASPADRALLTSALGRWPHVVWAVLPR